MAISGSRKIDAYIATRPKATQAALKRVRAIIKKAMPGGEEVISYKIAAYRFNGRIALFYAGWADHYSLYPASRGVFTHFKDVLSKYEISKGTIRFSLTKPVPVKLIERIAKFRAKELA